MSSPFRAAMDVFAEFSSLTDDDLRVLLRSLGTDQLRRVMGIGHSALLQMDAHYATRIQLRDQALELAKQTMASQGVTPPTAPPPPFSPVGVPGWFAFAALARPRWLRRVAYLVVPVLPLTRFAPVRYQLEHVTPVHARLRAAL